VHPHYRTPIPAILITSGLAILLCVYAAAYFVLSSISTIALYLAYIIPVYLNWRNQARGRGEFTTPQTTAWSLGRWAMPIRTIAIAYALFIVVVFMLPPNELVLWTMLGTGIALQIYWFTFAGKRFTGPTPADEAELRTLEAAVEG
jgi:amino acid transporter